MINSLEKRELNDGQVMGSLEAGFDFVIPPITSKYCLAQLDDYMHLSRNHFPHHPPLRLQLEARISAPDLPGTWGFGLWNDPFSIGFGMNRALPVLPNTVWFFYGSSENFLSIREDQSASGFHAKVFKSPRLPGVFSLLAVPLFPFLFVPASARLLRRLARLLIKEDALQINIPVTEWHHFDLSWLEDQVSFYINGSKLFSSNLSPKGHLGCVIWMDNQYFRFDSSGKLAYGFEKVVDQQCLQIRNLSISCI